MIKRKESFAHKKQDINKEKDNYKQQQKSTRKRILKKRKLK